MNIKRNIIKFVIAMTILLIALPSLAANNRAVGWHWYNNIQRVKKKPKKGAQVKQLSASQQMKVFRELIREAKDRAILYPTEQNVRVYLVLQNVATENAAKFAAMWKKTELDYPDLDYGTLHPTENNAQQVIYAQRNQQEQQAIDNFRKDYGFFYFYRGKNALDKQAAIGVKAFCKRNRITVIPVSVDETTLPIFENSRIDHGQAKTLGVKYFPALILVNPKSRQIKPVSYGYISGDELRVRFLQVATNFKEGV